ncbi:hypothetical protein [Rivularia sp. UHCC 0363]|uniref:hypothetical protein n=1 Tax=Rivularia sp. UHCC 0363 TaxID=3110244 RepID=UPI002B220A6B|nr:hypothetical protein [Rivularia sp. UHCC 0363]MEA5593961.1 hypothetical protein [Rivularia sp. UHCC 0363]
MDCRTFVKYYLCVFVTLSFTPQPKVFAQSNSIGCQAELYQPSTIQLTDTPKLTATDIIGLNNVEQIGYQEQPLPTTSPYKSSATKNIANYWQMKVKKSDLPISLEDIKYRLIPSSEPNNPFKQNKFEPKPFGVIEREACPNETIIVSGGITLEFKELSSFVPGKFRGDIQVCVQIKDKPQC